MNCRECDAHVPVWHHVALCDRCLSAQVHDQMEQDDYVLLQRINGRLFLISNKDRGKRVTNLTALKWDPQTELADRLAEVFGI